MKELDLSKHGGVLVERRLKRTPLGRLVTYWQCHVRIPMALTDQRSNKDTKIVGKSKEAECSRLGMLRTELAQHRAHCDDGACKNTSSAAEQHHLPQTRTQAEKRGSNTHAQQTHDQDGFSAPPVRSLPGPFLVSKPAAAYAAVVGKVKPARSAHAPFPKTP